MIDLLFDGLDQVMEAARRRFPVLMTVFGLVSWAVPAALGSYLFGTESLVMGAAMAAGPLALVVLAGIWGIGRLPWPVWPAGVSTLVLVGGLFAPAMADLDEYGEILAVLTFVYVQVFLGTLLAVDALRRRRTGSADSPGVERTARRRVLQLKLLMATLLMVFGTALFDPGHTQHDRRPLGEPVEVLPFPLQLLSLFLLLLVYVMAMVVFVAVFVRRRTLAAVVFAGLVLIFVIELAVFTPRERSALILHDGWLIVTGAYLWLKAARAWYWPKPKKAAPAPGYTQSPTWPGRWPA